jgi:acyl-CoA synthetase (AMP-forming)/AMP-acid ligase II
VVIAHCRRHLAGFKVPRTVDWLDELPKTGSGKVLKRELRAQYWTSGVDDVTAFPGHAGR